MSGLVRDGPVDAGMVTTGAAGNRRILRRTCRSCSRPLTLVMIPGTDNKKLAHEYGYSCDTRFCTNVKYFEEETHDKPLIAVREASNGKSAHFRSAYGHVGGGGGGGGGVSEQHKYCAALLRSILRDAGGTIVFKAKCPKGKHCFEATVHMPDRGDVATEFPVGRMSLDVGVLDADSKEWFCVEVCHTHYTENNRAPLGWAECRTSDSLPRLKSAWETWTKAGAVGTIGVVELNDVRWDNPNPACKYPACPGCFLDEYVNTIQLTKQCISRWALDKECTDPSVLVRRLENLRVEEPRWRDEWSAIPFGGSAFFSSFVLPIFPSGELAELGRISVQYNERLAAKPEYEKMRRDYNRLVEAEAKILEKITRCRSGQSGAAELLLTIGPWDDLLAKVKLVRAAREQARLFSERFGFPMDSGAGFRTERSDRKQILDNYKALCTQWQKTVGPWSTVAEEAAKFKAAQTVEFGKHKVEADKAEAERNFFRRAQQQAGALWPLQSDELRRQEQVEALMRCWRE